MALSFVHFTTISTFSSLPRPNHHRPLPTYRPTKVTMTNNQSYWTSINTEVEAHLERAIPVRHPLSVFEPMHHLVFSAPRNMAPAICIAACELVGGRRDQAVAAASALHLIQAAAFTHEHLPLTDRAKPSAQHAFSPNIELLTGDAILPFGLELLARSDDPTNNNSGKILRVITEITRAMGSQGMVGGQYLQVLCDGSDGDESYHVGWMNQVLEKKEGGLYSCGAACGAILGGGSEEEVEKLRRFGLYVGMMHGMMSYGVGREEKGFLEMVKKLRSLALKELESFEKVKVEAISSLCGYKFMVIFRVLMLINRRKYLNYNQ